jgi:phenylacetate-CoA ligase
VRAAAPHLTDRFPANFLFHLRSTLPLVRREARVFARAEADSEYCRGVVDERLVAMVRHAHATVPHYRRSYDRALVAGFRGVDDLMLLPTLDRRTLQNKYRFVAVDMVPERTLVWKSSGTTAPPVEVLRDLEVVYHDHEIFRRLYQRLGPRRRLSPFSTSFIKVVHTTHPQRQWQPTMGFSRGYRFGLGEPAWDDPLDLVRFLAATPGHILNGAPMVLMELYRHARKHDPNTLETIRPALVLASGGPLTEATRATIAQFFGCPVVDAYAAEEFGIIAVGCPLHDCFHIEAPSCIVECLRQDGSPAPAGEDGDLVVTGLRTRSFPLIRYRIGDTGSLLEGRCECGSALPRLGRLIGRGGTVFPHRSGATVMPSVLGHALGALPITLYQIEQLQIDRFVFRYARAPGTDDSEVRERVRALFLTHFGPQVDLTLIESAELGAGENKLVPYISRLAPSERLATV